MKSLSISLLCCGLLGCLGTIDTTPRAILDQSKTTTDIAPPDDLSTSSPMTFDSDMGVITEDMADLIDDMYVSAGTENEDMLHTACTEEMCDMLDNDCDGNIDEGVLNACGTCGDIPEEICDEIDNDCDGNIDENVCTLLNLDLDGDCLTIECPPEAPYPIACQIDFMGSDSRGCVAYNPPSSSVYLQEGNHCGAGGITGILICSTVSRGSLNATNCPINKQDVSYPTDPLDCAEIN